MFVAAPSSLLPPSSAVLGHHKDNHLLPGFISGLSNDKRGSGWAQTYSHPSFLVSKLNKTSDRCSQPDQICGEPACFWRMSQDCHKTVGLGFLKIFCMCFFIHWQVMLKINKTQINIFWWKEGSLPWLLLFRILRLSGWKRKEL